MIRRGRVFPGESLHILEQQERHAVEVFADPLPERTTVFIVAHNHPSGNLTASSDNHNVTRRLKFAGELLAIPVLDYLIFSDETFHSMLEEDVFQQVQVRGNSPDSARFSLYRYISLVFDSESLRGHSRMKGINTPGQALEGGGFAYFSNPRRGISPCFPGTRSEEEPSDCFLSSRSVGESTH